MPPKIFVSSISIFIKELKKIINKQKKQVEKLQIHITAAENLIAALQESKNRNEKN